MAKIIKLGFRKAMVEKESKTEGDQWEKDSNTHLSQLPWSESMINKKLNQMKKRYVNLF